MLMTSPVLTTSMGQAGGVELGFHETLADGRRDDLLGLAALDELAQGPGVVFFGVVHDDVVDLVERHQLGEAAEHGSGVIVVHRVEHDVLLVADEIAVVGRAARGNGCSRGSCACCSRRPRSRKYLSPVQQVS